MSKKINKVDDFNPISLIKFVVIVVICFVAFYGITMLVTNKKETKKETIEPTIQYDEVLIGQILNRKNESYYVLVEDSSDEELAELAQYVGTTNNTKKVYYSELNNSFNKGYKSDSSNLNVDNISEIRFKTTSLLEIENGNIVSSYEEHDEILNTLKSNSTDIKE